MPAAVLPSFHLVHIILFVLAGWLTGSLVCSTGLLWVRCSSSRTPAWPTWTGGRPRCVPINNARVKLIKLLNIYVQTICDYVLWFDGMNTRGWICSLPTSTAVRRRHECCEQSEITLWMLLLVFGRWNIDAAIMSWFDFQNRFISGELYIVIFSRFFNLRGMLSKNENDFPIYSLIV